MSHVKEEVILYDAPGKDGKPVSGAALRARLVFNYKNIPYTTRFLEYPDIAPTLSALNIPASSTYPFTTHTVPAALISSTHIMDSHAIALAAESAYPNPPLCPSAPIVSRVESTMSKLYLAVTPTFFPRYVEVLSDESAAYMRKTREPIFGDLREMGRKNRDFDWEVLDPLIEEFVGMLGENGEGIFFGGRDVGYADVILVSTLVAMRRTGEDLFEGFVGRDKSGRLRPCYEGCVGLGMLRKMD